MIIDFLNFLFKYSLYAFALICLKKMFTENFKNRSKNETKRKSFEKNHDDKEIEKKENDMTAERHDWPSSRDNETISQIFDFSTCNCLVSLSDDERNDINKKRETNKKDLKSKSILDEIHLIADNSNFESFEIFKSQSEKNLFFFEPVRPDFEFLSHGGCELSTGHLEKNFETTTNDLWENDSKGDSKLQTNLDQYEEVNKKNNENEEIIWNSEKNDVDLQSRQTKNTHLDKSEACEDDIFLKLNQNSEKQQRHSLSAIDVNQSNKKCEKSKKGLAGKLTFKNKEKLKMKKNKIATETNNFSPSTNNLNDNMRKIYSANLNPNKHFNNSLKNNDNLISNNMVSRFFSNHNFSMDLYEEKNSQINNDEMLFGKNEAKEQNLKTQNNQKNILDNSNKKNISANNKINDGESFIHGYYRNYLQRKKFHASVLPVYNFKVFGSTEVKANLNLSKEKQQYEQNFQNKLYLHNLQEKLKKKLVFQQEKEKKLTLQQKQHFNFQQKKHYSDVDRRVNSKDFINKQLQPDATKSTITLDNISKDIKSHRENKEVSSCLPCLNSFFTECKNLMVFNSIKIPVMKRNKSKVCAFNQNAIKTAYSDNNISQMDTRCNFSNYKKDISKNDSESLSQNNDQLKNYNGSTYTSNVGHNPSLTVNKTASSSQKEIQPNKRAIKKPFEINFVFTTNLSPQTNDYENSFCNNDSSIELDNHKKMKDLNKSYVNHSKNRTQESCINDLSNNNSDKNKKFWKITDYLFIGEKHYATNAHFLCQKSISGLVILYREEFKLSKKYGKNNFENKKYIMDYITETDSVQPNTIAFTERPITAVPCVCSQSTDRHNRSALRIDMSGFNLSEVKKIPTEDSC